ncbi:SusC/RagA family TonB-linked outer membrane protein [Dyadobacter frigoris]|uniref:TonB-dependent receptor n=2 Tax=Dyadobacter frigoris TaxID=2576211 RepID=A0A4U6D5H2_9BACT|nr:TonB-dependent receptor [Dyadobacter frigoris]GLU53394.1 SusC/RagA family TonB-linked outer membrane protein [Dyadobacter frigoris]
MFSFLLIDPDIVLAQNLRELKGSVTDAKTKEPIPGANIVLKGTTTGTSTDKDGNFSIQVSDESIITASFVGYDAYEVRVSNRSSLKILLEPGQANLDEVVVVGYGTQKKANLTGAVSSVDSKTIQNRPVNNLASALQGAAAGLIVTRSSGQPGNEDIRIQIRGQTSANGGVNPLLIVDGVAAPIGTLTALNPNDVENVTILKDAAAAAIYGAQAAGGVILVTTKKGKSGKTVFEYSTLYGMTKPMNLPERLSLLQEAEYVNLSQTNAGFARGYTDVDLERIRNNVPYVVNPSDTNRYIFYNQENPMKQILRNHSSTRSHNFSARGGTDKINYATSLGYFGQQGIFKVGPDKLDRINARINMGVQLTKSISFDTRIAYTHQEIKSSSRSAGGVGSVDLLNQLYRFRQRWPLLTPEGRLNGAGVGSGIDTYAYLKEGGYNNTNNNNFDGVFTLKVATPIKGLQLRGVYGAQYQRSDNAVFNRTVTTWYRYTPGLLLNSPNSYGLDRALTSNKNVQFLADYDVVLGTRHKIHALAGYQWEDSRYSSVYAAAQNLISNDLPSLNLGDNTTKTNSETIYTYANQSYFGRLNYSFADKYLFEATLRMDESSRLSPDLRRKTFPAVSAGWNLQKEDWFANVLPLFSEFKLRGSWGQLGSALGGAIGYYDYMNVLSSGSGLVLGNPETRSTYFYQSQVPSANLTWETVQTTNWGADFGFLKNKLQVSADYYVKYNKNMLTPQILPATFGVSTPRKNNGELKSWGWELEAKYNDRAGNLIYSVGFNVSDNNNKLISYNGEKVIYPGTIGTLEGYGRNSIWGYKTDGYFKSKEEVRDSWTFQDTRTGPGDVKYIDVNGDGRINSGNGTPENHGDLVYMGTDQPRYTFGFNGSMEYKGFDFSFFLQGVGKRTLFPTYYAVAPQPDSWIMPLKLHMDYWTPENPNARFPRPYLRDTHNYLPSDKWIFNGRYVRLKNIQVGYSLPSAMLSKIKISRARIFFSGQDLLTLSSLGVFKQLLNPEYATGGGHDYPIASTASLGLNISF